MWSYLLIEPERSSSNFLIEPERYPSNFLIEQERSSANSVCYSALNGELSCLVVVNPFPTFSNSYQPSSTPAGSRTGIKYIDLSSCVINDKGIKKN